MSNSRKKLGLFGVTLFSLLPVLIWFIVRAQTQKFSDYSTTTRSLGQIFGLVGLTLFALSFILTTRLKILERSFGGLDKVYKTHHVLGALAFIFVLFHPILLVLRFIPQNINQAAIYLLPGSSWPYNFGIISLVIMTVLIILTLFVKIAYQNWKISHKFMGIAFIFACFHAFLVTTDITFYPALKYYMFFISLTGLISYSYTLLFKRALKKVYSYEVITINSKQSITQIELKPIGEQLLFKPGQFIFIKFKGEKISGEQHPFTIASAPDKNLNLAIKNLGDYTSELYKLKPGVRAEIEGPYGNFDAFAYPNSPQIWIAGGIGVTPFLSFVKHLAKTKSITQKIDLIYCTKTRPEAIFLEELNNILLKNNLSNVNLIYYCSTEKGPLTSGFIKAQSQGISNKEIFLCGPPGLMEKLVSEFKNIGVNKKNLHYEEFNLK